MIVRYSYGGMNLRSVEGFVKLGNANGKNALKKLGYQYEETMRDC